MKTLIATLVGGLVLIASSAMAQDQMYFPAVDNVSSLLVQKIHAETQRIDMSCWYLSDDNVVSELLSRFNAGVQVRLIGDRGSIFEIDQPTKLEFYRLAAAGVPIRLRYNPTWYPEIDHWKTAIFKGQGLVAFGSANYTPYELAPFSSTNYDDETVLFTTDTTLVGAFLTKFDQYWNDTTFEPESQNGPPPYFKNWDDACATESACSDYHAMYPSPKPMQISTARLEPNNPMPADLIWGQGPDFNNRLVQEINAETSRVDFVIYRITVDNLTNALLAKFQSGVPMRLIVEPGEYLNRKWPEFWLTHANEDKLWAAGVPIKQRTHEGLTHMKMLVTSNYATNASSNYAAAWQRDQDYFVSATQKPTIYQAMKNRFQIMWTDSTGFIDFVPQGPDAPTLASPTNGQTGVGQTPTLTWNIATFATSYDVYVGTSQNSMALVGNVPAQMVNNPPTQYSFTPSSALQGGTTYFWKVVSRTNATPRNGNLIGPSSVSSFTTTGSSSQPPAAPGSPAPTSGATGVSTSPTLTWASSGATSYDVKFGTTSTPPVVSSGQAAASFAPGTLAASTTYFWQIVAHNSAGAATGAVWSFTTAASGGGGTLPSPWQSQDIGATGATGSASFAGSTFTVSGSGADIWGTVDAFRYVQQPVSGNTQIIARAVSLQNTSSFAKAGVMLRESTAANAAFVILDLTPGGGIEFMTRPSTGAAVQFLTSATQPAPAWLKLTRSGNTVTGSVSANGSTWSDFGTTTVSFSTTADLGLIVTSHAAGTLATATFDNVSVGAGSPPPPPPPPVPSPWQSQDVGATGATGSASFAGGTFTVSGSGADIWSTVDAFQYVQQPVSGNTQIIARAVSLQNTSSFAKAGVMLRESTAANAAFVILDLTPGGGIEFMTRPSTGAAVQFLTSATQPAPAWLKLTRSGNTVTGSVSANGTSWSDFGTTTVSFSTTADLGLVVTSHAAGTLATATFDNVSVGAGSPPPPPPPPVPDVVIYSSDVVAAGSIHGSWTTAGDASAAGGMKLVTPDNGIAQTNAPLTSPTDYFDVTFTAQANTPYTIWLRLQALGNNKFNDSLYVQFSDASAGGSPVHPIGSAQGLLVNLATDSTGSSLNRWGWQNGAYWLSQATTVTFATTGTHMMRVQVREDGVELDQIVLSPTTYLNVAPGPVSNDSKIVSKP